MKKASCQPQPLLRPPLGHKTVLAATLGEVPHTMVPKDQGSWRDREPKDHLTVGAGKASQRQLRAESRALLGQECGRKGAQDRVEAVPRGRAGGLRRTDIKKGT